MSYRELRALQKDLNISGETLLRTRMTSTANVNSPHGSTGASEGGEIQSLHHKLAKADRTEQILKLRL